MRTPQLPAKTGKLAFVDESISDNQLARFKQFAATHHLVITDYRLIRQLHPGIPDAHILQYLLNDCTLFITTDRPLHNTVLAKGLESYYVDERITGKPLPGIQLKKEVGISRQNQLLQESYIPAKTEIRALLLPDSEQRLKKLRTKRRRIREYFGGLDQMDAVAVTVSRQNIGPRVLIGVRIQITSRTGLKAMMASESYTAETLPAEYCGLASLSYALALLIQLMVNSVKTIVYYDNRRIDDSFQTAASDSLPYRDFFERLSASFAQLEFVPVTKGRHIEDLREKLTQLGSSRNTNEIQQDNFQVWMAPPTEKCG